MSYEVELTDDQWRERLGDDRYEVLRRAGTEAPFTGSLLEEHRDGTFRCGGCGEALFRSTAKFDSGSGWPSFDQAIPGTVLERADRSHFMRRTEIVCARCGGHLGHVFEDGPATTGRRFCVNSLSIDFDEGADAPATPGSDAT